MIDEEGMEPASAGDGLAAKLARYPGPAWRKAYLAKLLENGRRFETAGNERAALYCFSKVGEGIEAAAEAAESDETESLETESLETETAVHAESGAATEDDGTREAEGGVTARAGDASAAKAGTAADRPRKPRAQRKPKEKPLTATEKFRREWRLQHIKDAENVLARHGGRLSALEAKSYRERLEKLRQTGLAAATSSQSDRADAGILDLRRRLYQRVLKSQRISLAHRHSPVTLERLALPPARPGAKPGQAPGPSLPAIVAPAPKAKGKAAGKAVQVQTEAEWQAVVGPYNDRYNMEELLVLIAENDAAWVQEFLELYRNLAGVQDLISAIVPAKK
jgi:hypothetical protein